MRRCTRCGQEKPDALFIRWEMRRHRGGRDWAMKRVDNKWCGTCYNERYAELYNLLAFGARK